MAYLLQSEILRSAQNDIPFVTLNLLGRPNFGFPVKQGMTKVVRNDK